MNLTLFQVHILRILEKEEGHEVSAQSLCVQMTGTSVEHAHKALLVAIVRDIRLLSQAGLLERRGESSSTQRVAITVRGSMELRRDARKHGRAARLKLAILGASVAFISIYWALLAFTA